MIESQSTVCSNCGRGLPRSAAEELCPACLMTLAMEVPAELTGSDLAATELAATELAATELGKIELAKTELAENRSQQQESLLVAVEDDQPDDGAVLLPTQFGNYRLIKVLGKGGMGVVYEAEQTATGRRVALKMLGGQLNTPEVRQRFLREGRLAAGVSHPNSVYVFGTEEIEGLPVITMEVAGGGTLQDALDRRGSLPIVEAVNAMLDVVEGLEAALSKDVLHRDIKPSNCFVDPDGQVKVGDFGLSVSTVSSVDTFATATGVALGTPAFASPEQLRGNQLDHRSDIYSIGSTLYTLLSGQQPLVGNNAVQIVAAVLDEIPKPLTLIRPDIPVELAAIVAKCLAKKPELRYPNYPSLRAALLPFSSRRPEPEPPPVVRRVLAGMIDVSIAWAIPRTMMAASLGSLYFEELWQTRYFWWLTAISAAWYLVYYNVTEGRSGASVGKQLLGLRVMMRSGRPVNRKLTLLRSLLSLVSLQNFLLLQLVVAAGWVGDDWSRSSYAILFLGIGVILLLLPAASMKRRNGWAMVWDKLSNTRVVMPATGAVRTRIVSSQGSPNEAFSGSSIGPYRLRRTIVAGEWYEAIDAVLDRLVWLRRRSAQPSLGSDAPRGQRRDVARPTRFRWQQSVHCGDEVWDAFEAKDGVSLPLLLQQIADSTATHWSGMRHWLYDLSLELASAAQDGTLPNRISLANVWITRQGHAVLLDDPFPIDAQFQSIAGCDVDVTEIDVSGVVGQQQFLHRVGSQTAAYTVPTRARDVLGNIAAGSFERMSFLAGNLRSMLTKPARIDRGSRATAFVDDSDLLGRDIVDLGAGGGASFSWSGLAMVSRSSHFATPERSAAVSSTDRGPHRQANFERSSGGQLCRAGE